MSLYAKNILVNINSQAFITDMDAVQWGSVSLMGHSSSWKYVWWCWMVFPPVYRVETTFTKGLAQQTGAVMTQNWQKSQGLHVECWVSWRSACICQPGYMIAMWPKQHLGDESLFMISFLYPFMEAVVFPLRKTGSYVLSCLLFYSSVLFRSRSVGQQNSERFRAMALIYSPWRLSRQDLGHALCNLPG